MKSLGYPRFMTSLKGERKIVSSETQALALGDGWFMTSVEAAQAKAKSLSSAKNEAQEAAEASLQNTKENAEKSPEQLKPKVSKPSK